MANIVSKIADQVRPLGVSMNYGEPVEVGDQTLIPVSISWFGFGGGGDDENGGGGGGGLSAPVGAYVRRPGKDLVFEPNPISLIVVGIPFVWVAGRVLRKLVRALKK
ncbi:hypothetical protein KK103_16925 [Curtobacterium flaccumfaciens pv. flaccumfaciens]|uniref:Sporulation protein n=1 Tax=Curtobacterium flaccumfaciens pv. flaccumfaciens TaxID=138532 RepID=A0A9Q2W8W3_9MICO|nr:hypothetical protein [Curtobacterium flaccumfaciens]MBT1543449.1 hypothetical protein [Curtobacterium flaccumfaciens pv. flaccumfaciens]